MTIYVNGVGQVIAHASQHIDGGSDEIVGPFDLNAYPLNLTIASAETIVVGSGKTMQYLTANDSVLTISGTLQVDGNFVFMDLGV